MVPPLSASWKLNGNTLLWREYNENYLNYKRIAHNKEAALDLRAKYHGCLRFLDDQIGRLITCLKQQNLWSSTFVIFTSDHGELLGDHSFVAKGVPHFDGGIRCPLLVGGGKVKEAKKTSHLVSTLDLFPTICDLSDVEQSQLPPLEGKSFIEFIRKTDHQPLGYSNILTDGIRVSIEGVETVITDDQWRFTLYVDTGEIELYNLKEDPDEQHNLSMVQEWVNKRLNCQNLLVQLMHHPTRIPAYRNLAFSNEKRYSYKYSSKSIYPDFDLTISPWVSRSKKPCWQGKNKTEP
jgi:arylsulfatase A-like enzyme